MDRVPLEIVQQILQHVDGPSNLFKVVRVCRDFAALALPYLYEDVLWTDPQRLARSLPVWSEHVALRFFVRSLTFSISYIETGLIMRHPTLTLESDALVGTSGEVMRIGPGLSVISPIRRMPRGTLPERHQSTYLRPVQLYADDALYGIALGTLTGLSGLRRLSMTHSRLPDEIFTIMHELPSLRELHVIGCIISLSALNDSLPDYTSLQITDLTLWGVYDTGPRAIQFQPDWDHVRPAPLHRFYSLLSCPTLRRLRLLIQRDNDLIETLSVSATSPVAEIRQLLPRITADLEELTYAWQDSFMARETGAPFSSLLQYLLQSCPRISKLTSLDGDPMWMPEDALPRLRTYRGPAAKGLAMKLANSPIEHLVIESGTLLDPPSKNVSILSVLEELHPVQLPLRELSLSTLAWDVNLLYAVFALFPDLHSLELKYTIGCPSEILLMSQGSNLIPRTPSLHTIALFPIPGPIANPKNPIEI
ncbi:hypothetical protein PUNSTDRAFT_142327, partial [Punctularia strigosozonata HHB-11173 SS5]|uniref:uncharacterized protein n=1 Tax=Punctularia strigosozonata (strain HHB-11173) TaxID=741275 RepID=UPI0004417FFD